MGGLAVDVAIVGGGPGGLAAAKSIKTARPDLRVAVFERSSDITVPRGAALDVLPNGLHALQAIDPALRQGVQALDAKHVRRKVLTPEGPVVTDMEKDDGFYPEERRAGDIIYVAWHDLRLALAESLPAEVVHTGMAFEGYEEVEGGLQLHLRRLTTQQQETERVVVEAKLLVGADGNQSAVREKLLGDGPPHFMGMAAWRAVLPVAPPCWDSTASVRLGWVEAGTGRALSASALQGGRVSVVVMAPWPTEDVGLLSDANYIQEPRRRAEQAQQAKQRCLEAVAGAPEEVVQLLEAINPANLVEHGQFYREQETCTVWGRGHVTLLGDAAHLATPSLAQGVSQALEDALELGRAVHALGASPEALRQYEGVRQPQNAPVQAKSVQLFKEFTQGKARPIGSDGREFTTKQFEPLPRGAVVQVAT